MKFLKAVIFLTISLFIISAFLLFTQVGNSMIKPFIEVQINKHSTLNVALELKELEITPSSYRVEIDFADKSKIITNGDFDIFDKKLDLVYELFVEDIALLDPNFQGEFGTKGTINGSLDDLILIEGDTSLSKESKYRLNIENSSPKNLYLNFVGIDIATVLFMTKQKSYATGKIDIDASFDNLEPSNLDGKSEIKLIQTVVNQDVMKKDFGVDIPQTVVDINLNSILYGDKVNYDFNLNSNLAKITSIGSLIIDSMQINSNYDVNIQKLELFKPITNMPFRGEFKTSGTVIGNEELALVDGVSNLANSETLYKLELKKFNPYSLKASIKNMDISKLLYIVGEDRYSNGYLHSDIEIKDIPNLQGDIDTTISRGYLNSKVIKENFNLDTPKIYYSSNIKTNLNKDIVNSNISLKSTVLNLTTKKTIFDISKGSLVSDYLIKIANLNKLAFLAKKELEGSMNIEGDVSISDRVVATLTSHTLGGKIDGKLDGDVVTLSMDKLSNLALLKTMKYPQIFDSKISLNLDYNIATANGVIDSSLTNGHFMKTEMGDIIKELIGFDITKELYETTIINSKINKNIVTSNLDMKSKHTTLKSKDAVINLNNESINALIDVNIDSNEFGVKLTNKLTNPDVDIKTSKLIKERVKKELNKELNKIIEKNLGGDENVQNLLNSFFK